MFMIKKMDKDEQFVIMLLMDLCISLITQNILFPYSFITLYLMTVDSFPAWDILL